MLSLRSNLVASELLFGKIGVVWLTNEAKKNAIDGEMLNQLKSTLEKFENDSLVRCIVLAAKGDHFSVGVDLEEIRKKTPLIPINETLGKLTKPTIAAVHGYAVFNHFVTAM